MAETRRPGAAPEPLRVEEGAGVSAAPPEEELDRDRRGDRRCRGKLVRPTTASREPRERERDQ